jgi:hypothetical protein
LRCRLSSLQTVFAGIAVAPKDDDPDVLVIGITLHDGTYSMDYSVYQKRNKSNGKSGTSTPTYSTTTGTESNLGYFDDWTLNDFILAQIYSIKSKYYYKVVGCGITKATEQLCGKGLAQKLWLEQDIVALTFSPFGEDGERGEDSHGVTMGTEWQVDEESDSVVRKAIE